MKKLAALLLIAISLPALAQAASQSVIYSWSAPTTRVDGTALPAAQIGGYELIYTIDSGTPVVVALAGSIVTNTQTLNLSPRVNPYVLVSSIKVVDTSGVKSVATVVTNNITVLSSSPSAPGSFKATISCNAGSCSLIIN
jgi:hypothetical protein